MTVMLIIFLGPPIIYLVILTICALDGTLEAALRKDAEECDQIRRMYSSPSSDTYNNPQSNGLDEAYMLFMGDAVLRSNHPEATAAQREYYNDNHNCEAW